MKTETTVYAKRLATFRAARERGASWECAIRMARLAAPETTEGPNQRALRLIREQAERIELRALAKL